MTSDTGNPSYEDRSSFENSNGEAALIGSSLTFSEQMVRILNTEFSDLSFRRYGTVEEMRRHWQSPCLIILDYAASDQPVDLARTIQAEALGANVALAYRSLEHAPELCDGTRLRAISPPLSLVPINVSLDVWLSLVRLLACGEDFIPREIIHAWHMNEPVSRARPFARPTGAARVERTVKLTKREMEVLPLIAEGRQNKAIADALGLSEHTVKLHTHNIFQKLRVSNRTSAADWYRSNGRSSLRDG